MKTNLFIKGLIPLLFVLLSFNLFAQQPAAQVKICNDTLLDSKNYQFDVYLRAIQANGVDTFNFKGFQGGLQDSLKNVKGTGTPSISLVPSSSQLDTNPPQQPLNVLIKPTVANPLYLQINPNNLTLNGMRIYDSVTDPLSYGGWRRVCTIKITNPVDFLQAPMHLFFSKSTSYPTVVQANYTNPIPANGNIPVDTLNLTYNPILNKPITKYNILNLGITSGLTGTTIGLSSSELNCAYKLYNGVIPDPIEIVGTGGQISWLNKPNGYYTIIGRRIATYITDSMYGNVVINNNPNLPAAASAILGSNSVCKYDTVFYHTSPIVNADSIMWTYSGSGYYLNHVNDTTIYMVFGANATSGNLVIFGKNSIGSGVSSSKQITVKSIPANAGNIIGTASVCAGQSGVVYRVAPILNATGYIWTLPAGYTGVSNVDSIIVSLSSNAVAGTISVQGTNSCGVGAASLYGVTITNGVPGGPGYFSGGPGIVCQGYGITGYKVHSIVNASSYVWTLPGGVTGSSTTDSITVNYTAAAVSGSLMVSGKNACGIGGTVILNIVVNPLPANPGTIYGNSLVCLGQGSFVYYVAPIANATSKLWTLPNGVTGSSSGDSITVNFNSPSNSGNITVKGVNSCGIGPLSTLAVAVNNITPPPLVDSVPYIAYGDSNIAITAHPNGSNLTWYHTPTGGTSFFNDSIYHTGKVYFNDTLYVQAQFGGMSGTVTVGNGNVTNNSTVYPSPYGNYFTGSKEQYLILASELTALGNQAGKILNCGFNVVTPTPVSTNGASPTLSHIKNYTIRMGATSLTALTNTFVTGLTQVLYDTVYKDTTGWNIHQFTTPFVWDGVSNIVIENCFDKYINGADYGYNATVMQTTTNFTSALSFHSDGGSVCSNTTGTLYNQRPNIKLGFTSLSCPSTRTEVVLNVLPAPIIPHYNMGGTIFANLLPIDHAVALLYDSTFSVVDSCGVDSLGFYNFHQKAQGNYKVKAVVSSNSTYNNQYVPTYYASNIFWNTADTIKLFSNQWGKDIHLQPIPPPIIGTGSIQGTVANSGTKAMIPRVEVLLLDSANNPLAYQLTDANGVFKFTNLSFRSYIVHPEIAGKITAPAPVVLNTSNLNVNNIHFVVSSGNVILLVDDNVEPIGKLSNIYPNPASNEIILEIIPKISGAYHFDIYNSMGQLVYSKINSLNQSPEMLRINVSTFASGLYQVVISDSKNNKAIKRFVKSK